MPAVAVAGAVFAGMEIATVGLAAMSTMGAIAAVGAVAAGIGVVTGNETLTKIGGVMGIVGGVGALASGQGMLAGSDVASNIDAADAAAGASMTENAASAATAGSQASGIINEAKVAPVVDANMVQGVEAEAAGAGAPAPVVAADASQQGLLAKAATPSATETAYGSLTAGDAAASAAPTGGIVASLKDFAAPVLKFAKENQMLTYGMMQVGGSFMQGLFDTTTEAKKKALESQSAVNDAQAAALNSRTANINAPLPTAGTVSGPRAPVYRSGAQPVYVAPGLLQSKVTGVPA